MILSIVICTFNRAKILNSTLNSLNHLALRDDVEIIVIDNNSNDNTKAIVHSYKKIKYILEKKKGLSNARNRGVDEAKGEYVAFLDDDVLVPEEWLENVFEALGKFRGTDVKILGGRVRLKYESGKPDWISSEMENYLSKVDYPIEMEIIYPYNNIVGANMIFSRELFNIEKFNPNLGRIGSSLISGEESLLCYNFQKRGIKIMYMPNIEIFHIIPENRTDKKYILERVKWGVLSDSMIFPEKLGYSKIMHTITTFIKLLFYYFNYLVTYDQVKKFNYYFKFYREKMIVKTIFFNQNERYYLLFLSTLF